MCALLLIWLTMTEKAHFANIEENKKISFKNDEGRRQDFIKSLFMKTTKNIRADILVCNVLMYYICTSCSPCLKSLLHSNPVPQDLFLKG